MPEISRFCTLDRITSATALRRGCFSAGVSDFKDFDSAGKFPSIRHPRGGRYRLRMIVRCAIAGIRLGSNRAGKCSDLYDEPPARNECGEFYPGVTFDFERAPVPTGHLAAIAGNGPFVIEIFESMIRQPLGVGRHAAARLPRRKPKCAVPFPARTSGPNVRR